MLVWALAKISATGAARVTTVVRTTGVNALKNRTVQLLWCRPINSKTCRQFLLVPKSSSYDLQKVQVFWAFLSVFGLITVKYMQILQVFV